MHCTRSVVTDRAGIVARLMEQVIGRLHPAAAVVVGGWRHRTRLRHQIYRNMSLEFSRNSYSIYT